MSGCMRRVDLWQDGAVVAGRAVQAVERFRDLHRQRAEVCWRWTVQDDGVMQARRGAPSRAAVCRPRSSSRGELRTRMRSRASGRTPRRSSRLHRSSRSVRFGLRQGEIALADAAVETEILRFEPSLVRRRCALRERARARPSSSRRSNSSVRSGLSDSGGPGVESAEPVEIQKPAESLIGERRIGVAVAEHDLLLRSSAGRITSITCCRREAANRNSLRERIELDSRSSRIARMRSADGVPPGSLVTHGIPRSHLGRRRNWVVFPDPSIPSNVINIRRAILLRSEIGEVHRATLVR